MYIILVPRKQDKPIFGSTQSFAAFGVNCARIEYFMLNKACSYSPDNIILAGTQSGI